MITGILPCLQVLALAGTIGLIVGIVLVEVVTRTVLRS